LIIQIVLGLQIRESVDWISRNATDAQRDEWIQMVPQIFYVHRSFSWVILGLALILIAKVLKSNLRKTSVGLAAWWLVALIVFEMLLGGALNHLGFPAVAQPVHLLVAHLIFGLLWMQWCLLSVSRLPDGQPVATFSSSDRNSYV
jgi:cytochrome c oxidase assembly protein subunit 15